MKSFFRVVLGAIAGVLLALGGVYAYGRLTEPRTAEAPPLPEGMSAVITHIAGPVYVIRGEETIAAAPGERLAPGDILKVTEGAVAQVQMADKGSALLGSDTLVRFLKLTGADQQLEMRTEILTGSLSYKVEALEDDESIIILAEGTEYEVHGTEFLIEKSFEGTVLAVAEGTVRVSGNVEGGGADVAADQQLVIRTGEGPGRVENLNDYNRGRLEDTRTLPAMPFGYAEAPGPVRIEIETDPPDADIYIDGLKTGRGRFSGLLPIGTAIDVRVRRRGFVDSTLEIVADSNQFIEVALDPANLEETLAEEKDDHPLLARLREDYERRLAELRSRFSDQSEMNAEAEARIAAERAQREAEAAEATRRQRETAAQLEAEKERRGTLETELADSEAENKRLRDLIRQIQELAEE